MILKNTSSVYALLLVLFVNAAMFSAAEENIIAFPENFAFNFSGNYTIDSFIQGDSQYTADQPWSLGLGIRYKNTSLSLSLPLYDFANILHSFDAQSNSYYDAIYYEAFCRRYQGFSYGEEPDKTDIDLTLFSAGISAGWIQNSENHSLSAVYDLDKIQMTSSGSFLLGFGIFYTSISSNEDAIQNYREKQHLIYFGPTAGYSYTLILPHNMFFNINLAAALNAGFSIDEDKWLMVPQLMPRISFGHHNQSWSINFAGSSNYTNIVWDKGNLDNLLAGTMAVAFSKRF